MRQFLIILSFLSALLSVAQVNLSSSLSACYALNGNANDPVSSLNGTLSSVTPTVDRFNNAGSAYAFSGSAASRIELPNSPLLKANQVSFSAWVKFNTVSAIQFIVFAHNGCGSYHEGYQFALNYAGLSSKLQVVKSVTCSSGTQIITNGTANLNANTWYHVGFYAGPDSVKIYLNGNLDVSAANSNTLTYSPTAKVYLGGSNLGVNMPFNGTMDNVRFYNRKLNGSEFQQLYLLDPACLAIPSGSVPTVAFSVSSVSLCAGNSVSLSDLSTNNPTAWNWQTPGAITSSFSIQNPVITYTNPGTYIVSLVSSNSVGASNTGTQSIVVLPNPNVGISSSGNTLCVGQSMSLFAGGASTYTWSTNQTGAIIQVTPAISTSYSVTGSDLNGCIGNANIMINLFQSPLVFLSSSSTVLCQGQSATLTATGAQTYSWSNFQNGNINVVNPISNVVYYVTGTDVNNCTNTTSISIHVNSLPLVTAVANKTVVCRGNPVVISANGAQSYIWNNTISGATVQLNPTFNTSYSVVGTDSSGCKNQAIVYIQVSECVDLEESVTAGEIRVFPNPVVDIINIKLPAPNFSEIRLTDATGREIMRSALNGASETSIELKHLDVGVYYLFLIDRTKTIYFRLSKPL